VVKVFVVCFLITHNSGDKIKIAILLQYCFRNFCRPSLESLETLVDQSLLVTRLINKFLITTLHLLNIKFLFTAAFILYIYIYIRGLFP
jgi:hypothetical protein